MKTQYAVLGLAAGSLLAAMLVAPILASAVTDYLTIDEAQVSFPHRNNEMVAVMETEGFIPKDGSGGAFGYGVLTDGNAIVVTTTHAGVLDSQTQRSANDPKFHNHFVQLKANMDNECDPNAALSGARLEVDRLTFESPGRVVINGPVATLRNIPETFEGTNALDGSAMSITRGDGVDNVVSFTLKPVFDGGNLEHVCVENIKPANEIEVN